MAESSLVTYEDFSVPHTSGRNGSGVGCICVHHMAGNLSLAGCASVWKNSRAASAHYGIDSSGNIGQYVKESDAAWAVGNWKANCYTISIECANDGGESTDWHVSDATINACINLIADICQRRGWSQFRYSGDDNNGELTAHKWYASTACPGPYLYSKFPYIAEQVQKILDGGSPMPTILTVDGVWGKATTRAMQQWLNTTIDGIVSNQLNGDKDVLPACDTNSWDFDAKKQGGSEMIKALQKELVVEADGYCGPNTVKALQTYLKEKGYDCGEVDGICGTNTVKAVQNFLNAM